MADMKFLDTLEEVLLERGFPLDIVQKVLETVQAVDAVPVVRCRECKHCDPENHHCDHYMGTVAPLSRKPDDFCSYGERKDGDGNG